MAGGRPRAFDAEAALDRALEVFWRHGYEGASMADLTSAMGINRPSLYAAFGNKEELFSRVLDRYLAGPGGFSTAALAADRARDVVERLLYGAVELTTGDGTPAGCLNVGGVQACGPEAEPARRAAIDRRAAGDAALRERLDRAHAAGDLPPGCDPATLTRLVSMLTDGIAVQAASGASRAELTEAVKTALRAWPA
ncbi:MAG: hypothetical protein V7637_3762 [Mycobacteriales bacterium]|jgi:AcrR family transcriptional regulator